MLDEYNLAAISLCDEDYESEISYEIYDGRVVIHDVTIIKQTCKKGEAWYDQNGQPHDGPHWIRVNITDLLSRRQIRNLEMTIMQYRKFMHREDRIAA